MKPPPLRLSFIELQQLRAMRMRRVSKARRDTNRTAGLCINGASHGKATSGKLCALCRDVHNRGAS